MHIVDLWFVAGMIIGAFTVYVLDVYLRKRPAITVVQVDDDSDGKVVAPSDFANAVGKMHTHEKVELRPAYVYDCPECGLENFVNGLVPSLDEDDKQELRMQYGVGSDEEGMWMCMPTAVTCQHCSTTVETQHFSEGMDDDE